MSPRYAVQGFTREFLKGGAGTSEDLLQEVREAVRGISRGKKVRVVVIGVRDPGEMSQWPSGRLRLICVVYIFSNSIIAD